MEKVSTATAEIEEKTREIYCDMCGTHLGTIVEYANGYITTPKPLPARSDYNVGICLEKKWITLKGILCVGCQIKVNQMIRDAFLEISAKCHLSCLDESNK